MATTYTRQNVYSGGPWAPPVLWYARGVAAMQKLKVNDRLAWRFFAGIHGFDQPLWTQLGYFSRSDQLPSKADLNLFWLQCQHGSWYFLPWHRGYLLALEATVRAAIAGIKDKGTPPSDWALPYWNYFDPDENQLPPEFASQDWPDGKGNNPLFIPQRYGPNNDGNVFVPMEDVDLNALNEPIYTGVPRGDRGFGGVDTGFSHGGRFHGDLEQQPHDQVHGLVGGSDPNDPNSPGLMSDPDTAGLDPIFYLHHANIDRLWEVWLQGDAGDGNPTDPKWLKGPPAGQRRFVMPLPPDGHSWTYTPGDMGDLSKLNYTYDDLTPAAGAAAAFTPLVQRLQQLGAPAAAPAAAEGAPAMATPGENVELVGASADQGLKISGSDHVQTSVQLDQTARQKVTASLRRAAAAGSAAAAFEAPPDRVFLNLEDVTGLNDATAFRVYVNDQLAGTITLFGVRKASKSDGEHGGQGLTFVLEITKIVDALHLSGAFDVDKLNVRIAPLNPVPEEANIRIGRISIFRQGQ